MPAADLPDLYVAWPPEAERQIVSLRVLGLRGERIPGRLLRQGLAATGFRHGPFGIFHVGHDDGRVLFSAASLVRPGLLDPENMDFQHFPGVNLFAVLPAPIAPAELLERFCSTAFDLAGRIDGSVQDEGGAPLGVQESQDWRARHIVAFAQHAGAH
jgi:cell division protein ZipA